MRFRHTWEPLHMTIKLVCAAAARALAFCVKFLPTELKLKQFPRGVGQGPSLLARRPTSGHQVFNVNSPTPGSPSPGPNHETTARQLPTEIAQLLREIAETIDDVFCVADAKRREVLYV